MSLRGLLVLLLCFVVALLALRWAGHPEPSSAPSTLDAPLLHAFNEDAVREIELACAGTQVTLRRDDARLWRVVRPFEADADPRRVHEVVAALQDARVRKTIAGAETNPSAFGLAPAVCTVRLNAAATAPPLTLRIGRASPVGSERYAVADDARLVLTDGSLYGALAREAESFREKRLIPLEAGEITRIAIMRPPERLSIVLTDGICRLEAPLADAGAASACESLARAVTSVALSGPFAPRPQTGTNAERLIAVEVTAKGASAPLRAYIATAGRDGRRVAWRDGSAEVGLVGESAVSELLRPADSFRDLRIVAWSPGDVRRLTIERAATVLRLERAGETAPWTASAGSSVVPVLAARADAVVDALHDLRGSGFLVLAPSTAATATIAAYGDRGELARLTFGPLPPQAGQATESVWLTTSARPGVAFKVEASRVAGLPKDAADLATTPTAPAAAGS